MSVDPRPGRAALSRGVVMDETLNKDARAMEDAFFKKESDRLVRELKARAEKQAKLDALKEMMPKADESLVAHLVELGVGPTTVLALETIPLVAVAWADGTMDDRERGAILKAAHQRGLQEGSPNYQMLEAWLIEKPSPALMEAWKTYVASIMAELSPGEREKVGASLLGTAREVAEATGGFLGFAKISAEEEAVLRDLEQHLK